MRKNQHKAKLKIHLNSILSGGQKYHNSGNQEKLNPE